MTDEERKQHFIKLTQMFITGDASIISGDDFMIRFVDATGERLDDIYEKMDKYEAADQVAEVAADSARAKALAG